MKKWRTGKKLLVVLAACVLCWGAWRMLFGYEMIRFDPEVIGVVDVIVTDHHGDDDTLHYYNIGAGHLKQECEPFEPDGMTVYTMDTSGLESYIDREKNKVLNRLKYIRIEDAQGSEISPTPLMEAVVTRSATLEHDIMELHLFEVDGEIFLQTELNVNWWCPVELYWYDTEKDRLIELYTFDALEIVGLRIRDLERAR